MALYSDLRQTNAVAAEGMTTPVVPDTVVEDVESVYQSIHNILSTPKGTRLFLPEFGSDLESFLFEPIDEITAADIYNNAIAAIEAWDARPILIYGQSVVTPHHTERYYDIVLAFEIRGLEGQVFEWVGTLTKDS